MTLGIKTQGSELYALSDSAIIKIANMPNFEGLGGSASDIDVTNLDSLAREYFVGLADNGTASFGLNLDPQDASHQFILDSVGGEKLQWAIGLSDGESAPTVDTGPPEGFDLPSGRSFFIFEASVQQAQINFATDDVVRISGSLRVSGAIELAEA